VLRPELETMRWYKTQCQGTPPSARGFHEAAMVNSKLYVFGGFDGERYFADVHVLDLTQFQEVLLGHEKIRKKSVLLKPIQI